MTINNVSVCHFFVTFICVSTWMINLDEFTHCDFKAPYKCEIVHGIGLFPPANFITMWFGGDE